METVKRQFGTTEGLRRRGGKLTSDAISLIKLLAGEANRLNRIDEAARLLTLKAFISQRVEEAKKREDSSRYSHSKAGLTISLYGLAARGAVRLVSKSEGARNLVDRVTEDLGGEDLPFGTVLVCVGPKGLPDDVEVVSISCLARESGRKGAEIIEQLKKQGYLLATEQSFSLLMERLIKDVEEGRLLLPVSREKLSRLTEPTRCKPEEGKLPWVRCYWL